MESSRGKFVLMEKGSNILGVQKEKKKKRKSSGERNFQKVRVQIKFGKKKFI